MSPAAASSSAGLAGTLENRHLQLLTRILSRTTGKPKPFIKKNRFRDYASLGNGLSVYIFYLIFLLPPFSTKKNLTIMFS